MLITWLLPPQIQNHRHSSIFGHVIFFASKKQISPPIFVYTFKNKTLCEKVVVRKIKKGKVKQQMSFMEHHDITVMHPGFVATPRFCAFQDFSCKSLVLFLSPMARKAAVPAGGTSRMWMRIYILYIYICRLETFQESTNIRPYISPGVHWFFTSDVLQLWFLTVSKKYTYHQNEHVSLNTKKMVSANGIKHPPSWGIFWVLLNATPPPLKKTWSLVTGLLRDLN